MGIIFALLMLGALALLSALWPKSSPRVRRRYIDHLDIPGDRLLNMITDGLPSKVLVNAAIARAEVGTSTPPPASAPAPAPVPEQAQIFFKPGEPETFEEYDGQPHIVGYLQDAVRGALPKEAAGFRALAIDNQLLLGFAGAGKTLLAKVLAKELQGRAQQLGLAPGGFVEVFPADIPDVPALDAILRRVQEVPGSTVFIDEIHDFTGTHLRKLYLVLEEGRYQFHGTRQPVMLPPTTFVAATTDAGRLPEALKRRYIRHPFKPATPQELVGYIRRRPFPISEALAWEIVKRTQFSGAPWEGLELYRMAVTAAQARGASAVEEPDLKRVFTLQAIDDMGLRWLDRRVIHELMKVVRVQKDGTVIHAASIADVANLAQVDKDEYMNGIKPRLMSRKLITQKPGYGQTLTPLALERYGDKISS
jgi:Holliday junction resolvasome RuvABC ATP-dependent DNA helicase subunit